MIMAQAQPNLLDQIALLESVAGPGDVTAWQRFNSLYQETPKQQVDFELKDLNKSIKRQERTFSNLNVVTLNFRDPLEAKIAGEFFAGLFPDPMRAKLGVMELIMNAIEHGNLAITSEEKHELIANGKWMNEITSRLTQEKNQKKRVHAYCYQNDEHVQITIP